jgi:hypothetical protein
MSTDKTHLADQNVNEDAVTSRFVSVPVGARAANISPRKMWELIRAGLVPAWGTRKCYRVSLDHLLPRVKPAVRQRK